MLNWRCYIKFLALWLIIFSLLSCHNDKALTSSIDLQQVKISGKVFNLEIANTPIKRYIGLSERKNISKNGGMLFVFKQEKILNFVMRGCLVPIDIIFLGKKGRVVKTYHMKVEPYKTNEENLTNYSSTRPAQFAIELSGGSLNRLKITAGDKIKLPFKRLINKAK